MNGSVELLGIPNFLLDPFLPRISWFSMIPQVEETVVPIFKSGPFFLGRQYSKISIPWCGTIPACLNYMPRIMENVRAAACRVRDDFLRGMCCVRMRIPSTSCNSVRNLQINRHGYDREGPVDR